MVFLEIVVLVFVCAGLTRFLRSSESTAAMRSAASERSELLAKLLACPHCLSFWIALACTLLLRAIRGMSLLELGLFVLLGWRGAYYVNRQLDRRSERRRSVVDSSQRRCRVCGKSHEADFIERRGFDFCSVTCWFDYLRDRLRVRSGKRILAPSGELIKQEVYPVSFKEITPTEAKRLMDESGYKYVDVRSQPEFLNGHPSGALNIPIMFREAMGMVPNPDFLTVMLGTFDLQDPLLLGCQMGSRSGRAAEALVAAGFTDVANVVGGFGGARDEQGGVIEKGWLELGLPVDYGEQEGRNYAALAGRQ